MDDPTAGEFLVAAEVLRWGLEQSQKIRKNAKWWQRFLMPGDDDLEYLIDLCEHEAAQRSRKIGEN